MRILGALVMALTVACASAAEPPPDPEAGTDASEEPVVDTGISEEAIRAALERGEAQQHEDYLPTCSAELEPDNNLTGSYNVIAFAPLQPVASYAADLGRKYMPMPAADSPEVANLLGDGVFRVSVGGWLTPEYDNPHVVMRPVGTDREAVVQPLSNRETGGVLVDAAFAREDVLGIARQADAEVVIVTSFGEYSCTLSAESILLGYGEL